MSDKLQERDWFDLYDDENVEWWSHPSILMYIPRLMISLLLLLTVLIGLVIGKPEFINTTAIYGFFSLAILTYTIYLLVHWRSIYYIVTSDRVIRKNGIISREINPANFSRISNIKTDVSILEKFVSVITPHKMGDVHIHTADDNLGDIHFNNVKHVKKSRRAIQSNLSEYSSFRNKNSNPDDE